MFWETQIRPRPTRFIIGRLRERDLSCTSQCAAYYSTPVLWASIWLVLTTDRRPLAAILSVFLQTVVHLCFQYAAVLRANQGPSAAIFPMFLQTVVRVCVENGAVLQACRGPTAAIFPVYLRTEVRICVIHAVVSWYSWCFKDTSTLICRFLLRCHHNSTSRCRYYYLISDELADDSAHYSWVI